MEIIRGIAASPGFAIGRAVVLTREDLPVLEPFISGERSTSRLDAEVGRFDEAVGRARSELDELEERVKAELGESSAAIFGAHSWILGDPELRREVESRVRGRGFTAEYALDLAFDRIKERLRSLSGDYFAERHQDIEDVERRLMRLLRNTQGAEVALTSGPAVMVAHNLTPSQTVSFGRGRVLGMATDKGGRTSHAAILAQDLGIPAVVGLETATRRVFPGETVIVDGRRGILVVSPDEETLSRYGRLADEYSGYERGLTEEARLTAETSDGVPVAVLGNIEFPEEIPGVVEHGAEGIGLYRTEFLYMQGGRLPTEDEHLEAYRTALQFLGGRPIMIRTLDIGADKLFPGTAPAGRTGCLGVRSIRLCRLHPEMLRTQLRAILRASAEGNVKCMLPMISTAEELSWAKGLVEGVKQELAAEGLPFDPELQVGIMVEVPAAAVMADALARDAAFMSLGTNDLVQYTMASDRTDEQAAGLGSPAEPAVLRLIQIVVDAGARRGIPVSICGEMAGDATFVELLLGLGLRIFSVAPGRVPELKRIIRQVSTGEARALAGEALSLTTGAEVTALLTARSERFTPAQFRTDSTRREQGPVQDQRLSSMGTDRQ